MEIGKSEALNIVLIIVIVGLATYILWPSPMIEIPDSDGDGVLDNLDEFPGRDDATFKYTLYVASRDEPGSLDPAWRVSGALICITRNMYEGLVRFKGQTFEVEPNLATSWNVSSDGLVYTFQLRQDVKYHDGTPMNASSVAFGFNRTIEMGAGVAGRFFMVESVEAVADYTVQFKLKDPFPIFLRMLADKFANQIVSPTAVLAHATEGDPWAADYIGNVASAGTGPYKLLEYVKETRVVLEKFDDYWRGWEGNHVEKVVVTLIREASTNKLMLAKGDIDIAENIPLEDWKTFNVTEGTTVYLPDVKTNCFIWTVSVQKPPLDNVHVRRAIAYAIDYETIQEEIMEGFASIPNSIVPAGVPGHNPNLPTLGKDIEKAKQEMTLAGYAGGKADPPIDLWVFVDLGDLFRRTIATQIQNDLKELGLSLNIREEPFSAAWAKLAGGTLENHFHSLGLYGELDAHDYMFSYLHSTMVPARAGWNIGNVSDPYVDEKLEEELKTVDPTEREEILWDLQSYVMNETLVLPLGWMPELYSKCRRTWLNAYDMSALSHPTLWRSLWYYGLYKEDEPGKGYGYAVGQVGTAVCAMDTHSPIWTPDLQKSRRFARA